MSRTIYVCFVVCCLLLLCGIATAQSGEPAMENNAVQASRLIERVEPVYPAAAREAGVKGTVLLMVTIDEKGKVTEAKAQTGNISLVPAAIDAVKQWRYTPVMSEGRAVPVRTLVSVPFGVPPTIEFMIDEDGTVLGPTLPFEDIKDLEIMVSTAQQISYTALDKALKDLQSRGASHLNVFSLGYVFKAGQLFYQPGPSLSRIGINVQPPELDIDLNAMAAKAIASGVPVPKPISTPFGVVAGLSYLVGINATGEIVFVERQARTPDVPEIESALRQAHVKKPAYLDGKEVPAAIMISIPVQ
jgi:TonB family protein